jgi:hypothetical protein
MNIWHIVRLFLEVLLRSHTVSRALALLGPRSTLCRAPKLCHTAGGQHSESTESFSAALDMTSRPLQQAAVRMHCHAYSICGMGGTAGLGVYYGQAESESR